MRHFLRLTGEFDPLYTYADLDGYMLLDVDGETWNGLVWFDFGKPEMFIREVVVHPDHRGSGLVARRLLLGAAHAAQTYGSEGIAGFHSDSKPEVIAMSKRLGGVVRPGVRVRIPLSAARRFTR